MCLRSSMSVAAMAFAMVLVGASVASAITITFDGAPTGTFTSYTEGGYKFDWIGYGDYQAIVDVGGGNLALVDDDPENGSGSGVRVRRVDGEDFMLEGIEAANVGGTAVGWNVCLKAWRDGSEITQELFQPTSATFVDLGPTFYGTVIDELRINIVSLDYSGGLGYTVDNIQLAAVPEPLTLAGLVLGVGCLGGYLRRRRA